jgi:uncharacterized membrane protein YdjX (TVP38/TMEM64 family)
VHPFTGQNITGQRLTGEDVSGHDQVAGAETAGSAQRARPSGRLARRRLWPFLTLLLLSLAAIALGWHRHLSLETLARHHEALQELIHAHRLAALGSYVLLYVAAAALSVPVGVYLTVIAGMLFGTVLGGMAATVGATVGAICLFLIARSALGELLLRRAGPLADRLVQGFRADAFSYLLFLRLVPVFPFWLVNLVPALCGIGLGTFAAATALGILPATFAFASLGAGLDSVIAAQHDAYRSCQAAGRSDCRLALDVDTVLTPELIGALLALALLALLPVLVRRLRARRRSAAPLDKD